MFKHLYSFLFVLFLFLSNSIFAQRFAFDATIKAKDINNFPLESASIKLFDHTSGKLIESKTADKEGGALFNLEILSGTVYRIDIAKEGYITKKIIIDTKIPGIERLKYGEYGQKFVVKLDKGNQADNLIKPYRKIKYFSDIKDFNDDRNYIPGNDALPSNTNNQNVSNPTKPNDTKYTDAIKKGNDLLAQNKLPEAKVAFNEALIAKPGDKMAKDKIAEVDNKIKLAEKTKADEDKAKLDAEAKRKADVKAKAEAAANQRKYENALAQGNKLMAAKQFELAKDQFQNALIAKPDDKIALQKISDANRELAKGDELKRRQLKVMETLNLANALLKQNKLPESKLKFQEVLAIDPGNKDAAQKLKEIEVRQADTQKSKNDSKKIAELIARGDKNVAKENYPEAIAQYNEALKLSPNDKTITAKINNANTNLNSKKDKLYARAISNGDQAMRGKDYEIAKLEYERALALKPSDKYPKSQLKEVNRILLEMAKTLEEISKLSKEKASTADVEYLKDKQLKQEKLKVMKKEQEYLERKMKNLSTKYDTENPITKLYNVVDLSEKNKK
jgi:tetratricopeptide (TPR) repeat protein